MSFRRIRAGLWARRAAALVLVAACGGAVAADAVNGNTLYHNGPGGGLPGCAACHGATPSGAALAGANNASVVAAAIAANKGGMGMFAGRFTTVQLEDIAAYIANPSATASPAASVSPTALTFPSTVVGTSATQTVTIANTGSATLTLSSLALSGGSGNFALGNTTCSIGGSIAAGASCAIEIRYIPTAAGSHTASLVLSHNATGGSTAVSIAGTATTAAAATMSLSVTSLDVGTIAVGHSAEKVVTVQNTGQAPLTFTSIAVTGDQASEFTLGGTCNTATSVAASANCTVVVKLAPMATGTRRATLTLASNASNGTQSVALTGIGAATVSGAAVASPSALSFGAATVNAGTLTRTVIVTNTGGTPLSLLSATVGGAPSFGIGSGGTCGSPIAAGASCTVPVVFAPVAQGSQSAMLNLSFDAASPLGVPLSGSGSTQSLGAPHLSDVTAVSFADTAVGQSSAAHASTLSNSGAAAFKVSGIALSGANQGDFATSGSCANGASVSPGGSCTIATSFVPSAAGVRSATLTVTSDTGAVFEVPLSGNGMAVGAAALAWSARTLDFGKVVPGNASETRRLTLANSGSVDTTVGSITVGAPFAQVAGSGDCAPPPFALAAGASCTVSLQYQPTAAGSHSATITVADNSGALTASATLTGTSAETTGRKNRGGGGCSAAVDANDPMLAVLLALAVGVMLWRRRVAASSGETK